MEDRLSNHHEDENGLEFAPVAHFRRHSTAIPTSMNGAHRRPVELYIVRINPVCRVVWLYMLQHNIPFILIDVDFSKGEVTLPESLRKHPHHEVPILKDGEFVLFQGPAILTYLANSYTSYAGYGITLQTRMMCESLLSWANSELHRVVGYSYIYPQFLQSFTLTNDSATESLVETGLKQLGNLLEILEKKYLNGTRFLTGNRVTIADSFVGTILLQVEWAGTKFKMWPKVEAWLSRVKNQEHWDTVHLSHELFLRELGRSTLFD